MLYRGHLLFAACFSAFSVTGTSAAKSNTYAGKPFNWDTITPSRNLEYHDCYGRFKCARLEVPLDWLNQSDERTATIAMAKLPAEVPDDDATFGGPIITNPGGPGHSGIDFVLVFGDYLRQVVDKPGRRHYEIVSFDPRGIGRSTPRSDCYHDNLARVARLVEARGNGGLTNGDNTIAYSLAMMDAYGQRCQNAGDTMKFVGTPSVARDMVEMVDKIDALRKSQNGPKPGEHDEDERQELKKRSAHLGDEPGDVPRLQYIGFSYGTILGNYFASMFPGRVGRMLLDGVCNTDDYATGPGWLTNTLDADKVFDKFIDGCAAAGPDVCALARDSDTDSSDIRTRFDNYIDKLDKAPLSVLLPSDEAVIVTSDDVRSMVGLFLYNPVALFKLLAIILNELIFGNADTLASLLIQQEILPSLQDYCDVNDNITVIETQVAEGQHAVLCGDGDDISGNDVSWWRKYVNRQVEQSSLFGALWSTIRLPCAGWRIRPNWQFKGPFTSPEPDASLKPGQPAAPIFFLTNRLDPVTPLHAARDMAAKHPGARVIIQEAMGHAALPSAPSKCIKDIVANYFESGVIPDDETSCEADCGPWDENCSIFEGSDNLIDKADAVSILRDKRSSVMRPHWL